MSEIGDHLTLEEIVKRQRDESISLPTVQRGFVWKPHQIENLWDSLLRGYPIGSFVFSKENISSVKYELLDGQQRASAICLGFFNPLLPDESSHVFKTSHETFMIYIDRFKPDHDKDNRKYLFRVITKSHPWGYSRQENQKTLESRNISNAMKEYNLTNYNYLRKPLKEFWPYDAYKPIPLGLFISAKSLADLIVSIKQWKAFLKYKYDEELPVMNQDESVPLYSIREIYEDVQGMLIKHKIPVLLLDLSKLFPIKDAARKGYSLSSPQDNMNQTSKAKDIEVEDEEISVEQDQNNIEDRNISQIENLFIRLNSGGTPLRGEELNYSLLKSKIDKPQQKKIEDSCKGLYPSLFYK